MAEYHLAQTQTEVVSANLSTRRQVVSLPVSDSKSFWIVAGVASLAAFYFGLIGNAANTFGKQPMHYFSIWYIVLECALSTALMCLIAFRLKTTLARLVWLGSAMNFSSLLSYATVMFLYVGRVF
jgi:hypothetical protein